MNKTSIEWTDYSSNLIKYRDPDGKVVPREQQQMFAGVQL